MKKKKTIQLKNNKTVDIKYENCKNFNYTLKAVCQYIFNFLYMLIRNTILSDLTSPGSPMIVSRTQ